MENNFRERHDETIYIAQLRELESRLSLLQDRVNSINLFQAETEESNIPPLTNFVDNSDFLYSDEAYNNPAYTDDEDVLALWYARSQGTGTAWVENIAGTESTESIRNSSHGSGARANVEWDNTTGSIKLTGGQIISTRLPIRHAYAGNYLVAQFQFWKTSLATVIPEDLMAKVSIWDNTDLEIIQGTKPALTSTKIGTHTGGFDRDYILEVQMPDRRVFFSDTSVFTAGVNRAENTDDPSSINNTQTVSVSWARIVGSSRYRIYRRTDGGDWYLLGTITNGSTQFIDSGGTGGGIWTVPSFDNDNKEFQKAESFALNIGRLVSDNTNPHTIVTALQVPTNFTPSGDQFLQIEFLNGDYSITDSSDIPSKSLHIDRVGLSYTNGRWMPSARDLSLAPEPTGNPSPPPSTGGTGDNPPAGEGQPVDPQFPPLESPPEF